MSFEKDAGVVVIVPWIDFMTASEWGPEGCKRGFRLIVGGQTVLMC